MTALLDIERTKMVISRLDEEWVQDALDWYICPSCMWLSPLTDVRVCFRPIDQRVSYGGADLRTLTCHTTMVPIPPELEDTLWSAMRLGGMNGLVAAVGAITPEDVGLPSSVDKYRERRRRTT